MLKQFIEQIDRDFGGYNVLPFCGIIMIFNNYYRMATDYKLLNHNPITTLYDS